MSLFVVHGCNIWPRRDLQPLFSQSECRIIHKTKIRSTENMQMLRFTLEGKKSSDQCFKGFILMELTGHFSHINLSIKEKAVLALYHQTASR